MGWEQLALFLAAGLVGGAVNSAAGGAKLFVFPMLLAAGLPPIAANATSTIALWPAQAPAAYVSRARVLERAGRLWRDAAICACGGAVGALALIGFGERVFVTLIPLFLGTAVIAILFGERLARWAQRAAPKAKDGPLGLIALFVCGFYAGYFGAGLGFLVIAALMLQGEADIRSANAQKNFFSVLGNTAAVAPLALSGVVHWPAAVAVMIGGLIGGALSGRVIEKLPKQALKTAIVILGVALTLTFLARG